MANRYRLMTAQYAFMMDVWGEVPLPGTRVITWTQNWPPSANQIWTFDQAPDANSDYFYIRSNLDPYLVLDATGGVSMAGTPLQVWTQNCPPSGNQLWKFVPFLPGAPSAQGFIQSLLAPSLVVDVAGGSRATRGTCLELWPRNTPAGAHQLWFLLADPDNSYDPKISTIVPAGQGFRITGTGLQAGTPVFAYYSFYIDSDPSNLEQGSFVAVTDFGGNFANDSPITILNESPGRLQIIITLSVPAFSPSSAPDFGPNILALWDGSAFTIPS